MKRSWSLFFAFLFVFAGLARAQAPAQSSVTDPEVRKAIDAGNAKYIDAFARSDAGALAGLYDESGSRFGPKGVVVRGRTGHRRKRGRVHEIRDRANQSQHRNPGSLGRGRFGL